MNIHKVNLTGDYETTVYDAARRLLAAGADPCDRVETRRHGILSMSGVIGELAKLQVVFAATGPRLVRHKGCILAPLAAKKARRVDPGLPAHESAPDGGFPA
jgi:hypothetical protein